MLFKAAYYQKLTVSSQLPPLDNLTTVIWLYFSPSTLKQYSSVVRPHLLPAQFYIFEQCLYISETKLRPSIPPRCCASCCGSAYSPIQHSFHRQLYDCMTCLLDTDDWWHLLPHPLTLGFSFHLTVTVSSSSVTIHSISGLTFRLQSGFSHQFEQLIPSSCMACPHALHAYQQFLVIQPLPSSLRWKHDKYRFNLLKAL